MSIDPNNLTATATLTFDDEFNSLSWWNGTSGTWSPEYFFNGSANGGSLNDEQEWYINPSYGPTSSVKPWTVNNGVLSLTAAPADPSIQSSINNYQYTSGMITSEHSFSQLYGYFEIRAELPAGQGMWPAFWLLPADHSWPPEIDVFEMLGKDPSTLYTTVHYGTTNQSSGQGETVANTSTGFHTYGVDWEPDYITWYFDGQQIFKTPTPAGLDKPMYMLANLALGGGWGGAVDGTTPFPGSYQIDYIRAYSAGPTSSPPATTPSPSTTPPPSSTPPSSGGDQTLAADVTGGTLVGGTGNDTLIAGQGFTTMTGGPGSDTFVFEKLPYSPGHVTDFTPGVDKLDIRNLFESPYNGTDPVADGLVTLQSDGAGGTQVYFHTSTFQWPWLVTTLDNVSPSSISASDWLLNSSSSSTPPSTTPSTSPTATPPSTTPPPATTPGQTLSADVMGGTLTGGAGNDTLIAGQGYTTMTGGAGSDTFVFQKLPFSPGQITDFTPGVDKIDIHSLLETPYAGSDPVHDGLVDLISDGAGNTAVYFHTSTFQWPWLVTTLDNVSPSSISASDWITSANSAQTTASTPTVTPATTPSATAVAGVTLTADQFGGTLIGGDGNDTLISGQGQTIMTGGAGSDTFVFPALTWQPAEITDFTPGVDKIDIHSLIPGYSGSDPVADGFVSLGSDGAGGTNVSIEHTPNFQWPYLIAHLDHVAPSSLSAGDWLLH